MRPGEESDVIALVLRVFAEFVAPGYSQEGVVEFMKYASADDLAKRTSEGNFVLVAEAGQAVIGVIEIRESNHVSLLFVEPSFHRKGIGRELVKRAIERCRVRKPDVNRITVNASPNAHGAYRAIGFQDIGSETTVRGIRFIPMELLLGKQ